MCVLSELRRFESYPFPLMLLTEHQSKVISDILSEFPDVNFKLSQKENGDALLTKFSGDFMMDIIIPKEESSDISISY